MTGNGSRTEKLLFWPWKQTAKKIQTNHPVRMMRSWLPSLTGNAWERSENGSRPI